MERQVMREDLIKALLPDPGEPADPRELARRDQKKAFPKRFYKQAAVEAEGAQFALALDGKRARTPARHLLAVPSRSLAEALAEEWNAQGEYIDPGEMPLTRLINSALDGVAKEMTATAAEIVKYAGSDLLCYRATEPETLVCEQSAAWAPPLDWLRGALGARLELAQSIVFIEQKPEALAAIAAAVNTSIGAGAGAPLRAAALNVITTLSGSAVLALSVARGRLSVEQAWQAAHVDEDFQARFWGSDDEAIARRARRWREMEAAGRVLAAVAV